MNMTYKHVSIQTGNPIGNYEAYFREGIKSCELRYELALSQKASRTDQSQDNQLSLSEVFFGALSQNPFWKQAIAMYVTIDQAGKTPVLENTPLAAQMAPEMTRFFSALTGILYIGLLCNTMGTGTVLMVSALDLLTNPDFFEKAGKNLGLPEKVLEKKSTIKTLATWAAIFSQVYGTLKASGMGMWVQIAAGAIFALEIGKKIANTAGKQFKTLKPTDTWQPLARMLAFMLAMRAVHFFVPYLWGYIVSFGETLFAQQTAITGAMNTLGLSGTPTREEVQTAWQACVSVNNEKSTPALKVCHAARDILKPIV